jgi:hypothetical protein
MADIKAKDISVAQSITSSDLILGSSIAGTTANVTVETVGEYIIKQLNLPTLPQGNVESCLLNLNNYINNIRKIYSVKERVPAPSSSWFYTGVNIEVPSNRIYLVWGESQWTSDAPKGIALSYDTSMLYPMSIIQVGNGVAASKYCPAIVASGITIYLWGKRDKASAGQGDYYVIYYMDLGAKQN